MRPRFLIAAVAAALAILLCAELALRAAAFLPIASRSYIPDDALGYTVAPGAVPGTDAYGFNDEGAGPPGAPEILFVGDSFTYGTYPAKHVFPAVAARRLTEEDMPVRAVNRGLPGAGPDIYARIVRAFMPVLQPRAVVVTVYLGNDIEQGDPLRPTRLWLGQVSNLIRPWRVGPSLDDLMVVSLAERLARLARHEARRQTDTVLLPEDGSEAGRMSTSFPPETLTEIERRELEAARRRPSARIERGYAGLCAQLAAVKAEAFVPVLVVLAPSRNLASNHPDLAALGLDPANYDLAQPVRHVAECTRHLDLPTLDLTPALLDKPVYNRLDTHWNRTGNEIAGAAIAGALKAMLAEQ
jgi:hypothetical protein